MITVSEIKAAQSRIGNVIPATPLLENPFINELAGRRVLIKAECLQPTGSFKIRGGWSAISALSETDRKRGVIAYSSGNHAQGVALAAKRLGVSAKILMPADSPEIKIKNTRKLGAEVVLFDRATEDRDDVALRENPNGERVLIKPFDNEFVIAGQGTVGLEIAEQIKTRDVDQADVLVCCGGGGLTSGVALALEALAPHLKVRPVEPTGFDDVIRSLKSGKIEENDRTAGSLCDAVLTKSPGNITFPIMQRLCHTGIVVTEEEALRAMVIAWERARIVVEPGGAIALAAALFHPNAHDKETVIAIASGGNVDQIIFEDALRKFGGKS